MMFFDEVFSMVPENHKQVPREYLEQPTQGNQKKKNKKMRKQLAAAGNLSLVDLKERA